MHDHSNGRLCRSVDVDGTWKTSVSATAKRSGLLVLYQSIYDRPIESHKRVFPVGFGVYCIIG